MYQSNGHWDFRTLSIFNDEDDEFKSHVFDCSVNNCNDIIPSNQYTSLTFYLYEDDLWQNLITTMLWSFESLFILFNLHHFFVSYRYNCYLPGIKQRDDWTWRSGRAGSRRDGPCRGLWQPAATPLSPAGSSGHGSEGKILLSTLM